MRKSMVLAAFALAGCGGVTPLYVSHATAPHDGQEWHSCAPVAGVSVECPEGYACVKDGCEWCGPGETRCTGGVD
jgi:hypothetical protein